MPTAMTVPTCPNAAPTRRRRRLALLITIALACVGCDQASKSIAEATLSPSHASRLWGDTVRLQLAHNPGAFLGLGDGLPREWRRGLFIAGAGTMSLVVLLYALSARQLAAGRVAALGLLAAGGASNVLDRLLRGGEVVDFVTIGLGPVRTGVFNLADVAIMAGWLALALSATRSPAPQST